MEQLEIEILKFSYWEHFKAAKDLALVLPINHPKRLEVEKTANEILLIINQWNN